MHLFLECVHVNTFWEDFTLKWGEQLRFTELTPKDILLGIPGHNPHIQLLNHLLILAKHHIHSVKIKKRMPSIVEFKYRVKYIKGIEELLAIKRGKLYIHNQKWSQILNTL